MSTPSTPWYLWRPGVFFICGLLALTLSQPSEAGMLKWLFGETVQVSPEIHGVLLEDGEPKADAVVKRFTMIQDRNHWESTTTDSEGRFAFAERETRIRRGLFETAIVVMLFVEHYPRHGEDTRILYFSGAWDMKSPETDLLMSDISCELTGDEEFSHWHALDKPEEERYYRGFYSRCAFAQADRLIVPQWRLDELDLRDKWESLGRMRDSLQRLVEAGDAQPYFWDDLESEIRSGLGQIEDIREMETDPEKLARLSELAREYEAHWDLFTNEKER